MSSRPGDLCLRPPDPSIAGKIVRMAARLGYGLLAVEASDEAWRQASTTCRELGLKCIRRITIKASTSQEARRILRKVRGSAGIIALRPLGVDAARFAGRDSRIKLLVGYEASRYVDRSQRRLLRVGGGALEADLSRLLHGDIGYIIRLLRLSAANNIPLVLSSCAEDEWSLWPPRSAASISALASVPLRLGVEAVYINPWRVSA